jgi:hypothetical protein
MYWGYTSNGRRYIQVQDTSGSPIIGSRLIEPHRGEPSGDNRPRQEQALVMAAGQSSWTKTAKSTKSATA